MWSYGNNNNENKMKTLRIRNTVQINERKLRTEKFINE